jgi:hypothetical protein
MFTVPSPTLERSPDQNPEAEWWHEQAGQRTTQVCLVVETDHVTSFEFAEP